MAGKSGLKLWVVAGDVRSVAPKPAPLSGQSVGLFLRLLRERAGMTAEATARQVRIRQAYILAIEDDRFEQLPGRAYAIGFVRAYAEFLGADVEATGRAALAEIGRLPLPELRARKPEIERASRAAPVAAAAICLALAGYVYWYFENTRARFEMAADTLARIDAPNFVETGDPGALAAVEPYRPFPDAAAPTTRPTERPRLVAMTATPELSVTPEISATSAPSAGAEPHKGGTPLPPSRQDPSRARAVTETAPAYVTPTYVLQTQPVAAAPLPPPAALAADLPEPRLEARPVTPRSIPAPGSAMASTHISGLPQPSYVAAPAGTEESPPPAPGRVVLTALADTWLQIRAASTGKVLFSRVLREGESLPAPDRQGLQMTVGNAGGLEIRVDGQLAPALGSHGQVVRDIDLEGDRLLAGGQ